MKVRIREAYHGWYWDSSNGVTIHKDNRLGEDVNIDNPAVNFALKQGILEIVTEEAIKEEKAKAEKIINDVPTLKETIKEVVTPNNEIPMKNKGK